MLRQFVLNSLVAILIAFTLSPSLRADDEWAKDVPFHTKWEDAIKECKATGKLLFIYNGWKREKV